MLSVVKRKFSENNKMFFFENFSTKNKRKNKTKQTESLHHNHNDNLIWKLRHSVFWIFQIFQFFCCTKNWNLIQKRSSSSSSSFQNRKKKQNLQIPKYRKITLKDLIYLSVSFFSLSLFSVFNFYFVTLISINISVYLSLCVCVTFIIIQMITS